MKIINKISLFFFVLLLFGSTDISFAQTENKLAGKWESVFRKGKNNCKYDFVMNFVPDGKLTITAGTRFSECEEVKSEVKSWNVAKHKVEINGKEKTKSAVRLDFFDDMEEEDTYIVILEFEGDYMKVIVEVVDGDTTVKRTLIMKKVA